MQKHSDKKVQEIHVLVNNRASEQDTLIEELRGTVKVLKETLDIKNAK